MKEGEIRQKMENESKELYEKSQLLIKQKRDLLARLSRLRFNSLKTKQGT